MRVCRVCGCTDDRACVVAGVPCCWIEHDLCSACCTVGKLVEHEAAGVPWLHQVIEELSAAAAVKQRFLLPAHVL